MIYNCVAFTFSHMANLARSQSGNGKMSIKTLNYDYLICPINLFKKEGIHPLNNYPQHSFQLEHNQ